MIVVSIVGLVAGVGVPSLMKARTETQKSLCIGNLRVIDGAKEQWALINNRAQGEPVDQNEVDALVRKGIPHCPAAGSYTYGAVGEAPACSLAEEQEHILPWATSQEPITDETGAEDKDKDKKDKKGGNGNGNGKGKGKGRGRGRGRQTRCQTSEGAHLYSVDARPGRVLRMRSGSPDNQRTPGGKK